MLEGIKNKGEELKSEKDFENILNRFEDKNELKEKLLQAHEKIFTYDFLSTSLMWCAVPWVATKITKLRTHRTGFSASYEMTNESQTKLEGQKYEKEKKKKIFLSALVSIIPAIAVPKLVTKALKTNPKQLLESKNLAKNIYGKLLNSIKKGADNFDYTEGIFLSKTIFALIWILCDYLSNLISSRDKNEVKDRAIRYGALITMYFGGDFLLNNLLGRASDRFLETKLMNKEGITKKTGVLKKILMQPHEFRNIDKMKNIPEQTLQKTKTIGTKIYWFNLFANMALMGFGLPVILNKMLKNSIKKDTNKKAPINDFEFLKSKTNKIKLLKNSVSS